MKNFKRVISAVIALALSASTLVAVSAAKFADVDSKNNYAEAIDVLAALDVIHGYDEEEGLVFKPDGEITRAEAAVMIVGALNMNKDAQAAAGSSKFTDVNEQTAWAQGYVNVGVAQGYINGRDDTTFAPKENVNYADMCVMLTLVTGYGDYAKANGGYPTGYMAMASSAGINKGVALSAETPLKRGQVAQMLYNAITTPVLGITEYKLDGNSYAKLDGTKNAKETILSDKFDGIEVKATVTGFGTKAGTVNLTITDACGYHNASNTAIDSESWKKFSITGAGVINGVIIENDLDLTGYLQQEIRAILTVDENSKAHIVSAKGTGAVETIELAADDYVSTDYAANHQIKFGSTKYTFVSTGVDIYVNGTKYYPTPATTNAQIEAVLDRAVGTVKFAKTGTAANYNAIFADVYHVGQVSNVDYKNGVTTVKFSSTYGNNLLTTPKKIEISDNDVETEAVKITVKLGDKDIELKDLQENDVIAIKAEFTTGGQSFGAANRNITVLASRDTISGQVVSREIGTNENAFKIDSEVYAAVNKTLIDLEVGQKYNTIYLDPLGRLYSYNDETVEETTNYAILAKVSDRTDVVLVLPDGTKKNYEVKGVDVWGTTANAYTATEVSNGPVTASNAAIVAQGAAVDSVVSYTVKKGQISEITPEAGQAFNGAYKESVNKIQTVGVNDTTGIINVQGAATYKDYATMKMANLIDEETYAGAGFGRIGNTNNYSLVVLTTAGFDYDANSRFAVVASDAFSQGSDAEGFAVWQLRVLLNGEITTLNFTNSAKTSFGTPSIGDAFFYLLNSDGEVEYFDTIALGTVSSAGLFSSLQTTVLTSGLIDTAKWTGNLTATGNEKIQLVKGIVVGANANSVRIIQTPSAAEQPVNIDAFEAYTLAENCAIYTYDTDSEIDNDKDRLDAKGTLQASNFKNWLVTDAPKTTGSINAVTAFNNTTGQVVWGYTATADDNDGAAKLAARGINGSKLYSTLEGTTAEENAQYALALVVDDQVVEIYEVIQ